MKGRPSAPVAWRWSIFTLALSVSVLTGVSRLEAAPGDGLVVAWIPNLRDLGGYETADGKTVVSTPVYHSSSSAALRLLM